MSFEQAKFLSEIAHYTIVLVPLVLYLYTQRKDIFKLVINFYLIFFCWGFVVYLCNGCPITLLENKVSTYFYGIPFYPNYSFSDSVFYEILTWLDFYIPAVILVLIKVIQYYGSSTAVNRNGG